ncbi:putative carboxypeptidase S1 [Whalleya microplaca]|nr:putative carboxypeptidase S1 [Whalleya microplaca]
MLQLIFRVATAACLAVSVAAGPTSQRLLNRRYIEERNGINYNVFEHRATGSKMSFVKNSGICETTPGVNQYSGYLSVGANMNMWFWFFEARENPQKAPLVAYFEGGPGGASEYGLFTQNGPCRFVNNETTPSLNPYSFNEYANMLYVDQPIGSGFSFGDNSVNSTKTVAPIVWNLLQAFYDSFPEYESRDFGIFTESYGGHTGPGFAKHFLDQNNAIARGDLHGTEINLVALGISNGWFDAAIQEKSNIEFAYNNSYRQLINESYHDELLDHYDAKCKPAFDQCAATGTVDACVAAFNTYYTEIEYPLTAAMSTNPNFVLADVRLSGLRPPTTHVAYLQRPDVQKALGARVNYTDNGGAEGFYKTGDDCRSFLSELSTVVQAGVKVLIWTGDADYVSNWLGTLRVADATEWAEQEAFARRTLDPYTLNGVQKGTYKSLNNFSFMRIFEAGHNVPFYQPEASLQIFKQIMGAEGLLPT